MKNTIRQILNEDKEDRYVNYVVNDYMKNVAIFRNFEDYDSANDMRDYGWDGQMLDFAYSKYEDHGFRQDPEDEDVYYYEDSEYEWGIDEVVQDMFYIFIDLKVKEGVFEPILDGWREWKDMWDIVVSDSNSNQHTHIWEYDCEHNTYKKTTTNRQVNDSLKNIYAISEGDVYHKIIHMLDVNMVELLKKKDKICH